MRYACFTTPEKVTYPVALLVPTIRKDEMEQTYFKDGSLDPADVVALTLHTKGKKTPVSQIKEYIDEELLPTLKDINAQFILCGQGEYFKVLTGAKKVEANLGYAMDSVYGDFKVIYIPNYKSLFYNPEKTETQIRQALVALNAARTGTYQAPGADIIKFAAYPDTEEDIAAWLDKLIEMDTPLAIDIEGFSLKAPKAGIGTITMCWNQHEGIAFAVDYEPIPGATEAPFGRQIRNEPLRELLRSFFKRLNAKARYHSIGYDVSVLIYQLFMTDILDTEGLLEGMDIMLKNWDCTKLITYLAKNSCAGNDLSLKFNAQEFAGNYAQDDIHDITLIPLPTLLQYNLVDGLSTNYVYDKNWPTLLADEQLPIYQDLFQPATVDIVQMQLTGLPLNMPRVLEVKEVLQAISDDAVAGVMATPISEEFLYAMREDHVRERNKVLKNKQITVADVEAATSGVDFVEFNLNSPPQLQKFLYGFLGLPVIAYTDTKQPATGAKTLKALQNHIAGHPKEAQIAEFLDGLIAFKAVDKLLTAFIPAFEEAQPGPDGWHYLLGNFNLGGTVSGRLSSSGPNLQNLPSNIFMAVTTAILSRFEHILAPYMKKGKLSLGKLIKSCFEAPPGWIFAGLDFDSLEDRISALTTRDPNKLKVYTDGFDGHCLRAYSYYGNIMPDIDPESVVSINSIADKYPDERQASKVPTFLLTYGGTFMGIVQQTGIEKEKALEIEEKYHELYVVSDEWVAERVQQATKDGYVTVAFGLRVRTPLLAQVILGNSKTPKEAQSEARTAGNALGQSWCLLNSRASVEFMCKVRQSKYRLDIRPCAHIHDAQYFLIRDDMTAVQFTNVHLVKAVQWQEDPLIQHPQVKLGGTLSIFYPTWAEEIEIPNGVNDNEIMECVEKALA